MQINIEGGKIICEGIVLDITSEQVQDYHIQTGLDPEFIINHLYTNHPEYKSKVRDEKLKNILN